MSARARTAEFWRPAGRVMVALVAVLAMAVAACTPSGTPTPLPTKEKTVGRVQEQLQKADEDAAKRREAIDAVGK